MSEDEDVLIEGHELYKYLNQQGLTDFEVAKCDIPMQRAKTEQSGSFWYKLRTTLKHLLQSVRPQLLMPHYQMFSSLQLEIEAILDSGLLLEEDSNFLEHLVLPIVSSREKPLWTEISLFYGIIGCGSIFIWKRKLVHGIFPAIYIFLATGHLLSSWYISSQRAKITTELERLLRCCKDLYITEKKALHFVQENEVLYRGFTLAKPGSSALNVESLVVPCLAKRWYIMSGLRVTIAESSFEAINILQNAIQMLLEYCPLTGSLDKRNHYIAFFNMEELGIADIKMANATEFSLLVLKKLYHIYLQLQSEFLRRLALCFDVKVWKNSDQNAFLFLTVITHMSTKYSDLVKNLDQDYKLYYFYGFNMTTIDSRDKPHLKKFSKYSDVYVGVHSGLLYLQGMLHKTREFEETIESQENKTDVGDDVTLPGSFTDSLSDIITEIESCKNCFEAALSQLTMLNQPVTVSADCEMLQTCYGREIQPSLLNQNPIPVGFTDLDPQVEDEVFEAVINEDYLNNDPFESNIEQLTEADKIKLKAQKECSRRMLTELKTVLVHKAEEWKEREAKALKNKMIQNTDDEVTKEEVSDRSHAHESIKKISEMEEDEAKPLENESNKGNLMSDSETDKHSCSNERDSGDIFSSAVKPGENWPLARLKTGGLFGSPKSNYFPQKLQAEFSVEVDSNVSHDKAFIAKACGNWPPNFDRVFLEEESFCGSGENSDSECYLDDKEDVS